MLSPEIGTIGVVIQLRKWQCPLKCTDTYVLRPCTRVCTRTSIRRPRIPRSRHPPDPLFLSRPTLEATRAGADVSTRAVRLFLDGRV